MLNEEEIKCHLDCVLVNGWVSIKSIPLWTTMNLALWMSLSWFSGARNNHTLMRGWSWGGYSDWI